MRQILGAAFAAALATISLSACGGGGTATGGPVPFVGSGGGSTPAPGASASPAPGASGAATPTATPTPRTGGSSPTPTPAPTPTPTSSGSSGGNAAPTAPPDAPGHTNVIPSPPPGTSCRAGQQYNIYVTSGPTDISPSGSTEAFTVFEPTTICGGQTYPVIFNGPGFGSSRTTTASSFSSFLNNGYGVIAVDQAGEGEDGGKIRSMDPDQEGIMLLAVMNWAQAKLTWLAYGPTNDGADPHEPIFGSDGGSYGGMYQFVMLNVDKRHRLRAIVPQITPSNLNYSLFPGGIIKTLWDNELFAIGQSAGNGTSRAQFDPFQNQIFVNDEIANQEDAYAHDFFGYHSVDYFCNGQSIATNGGAGTAPHMPPTTAPPKINAMIWIGIRDTLFDFNNGYNNYACMQRGGGDVRLFSYQTGHNAIGTVPDPYVSAFYPANDDQDSRCGTLSEATAELDWFNAYLKGHTGAIAGIATQPCFSLSAGDGVTLPQVPTLTTTPNLFKTFDIGAPVVVSGDASQNPTAVSLYTAPAGGTVLAGIPHIVFDVAPTSGVSTGTPMVFVGVGILHASNTAVWDLMDNEVKPLRGIGHYDIDIIGGGARLQPGDQLGVLFFGLNQQFIGNGNLHPATPTLEPITITGKISLPILGPMASNI